MEPCSTKRKPHGSQSPLLENVGFGPEAEKGPLRLPLFSLLASYKVFWCILCPPQGLAGALGSQGAKDLLSPLAVTFKANYLTVLNLHFLPCKMVS